jgi:predicted nucleic acid-binding protein
MRERFEPKVEGPTGLFLDTSALFPYFDPDTEEHDEVKTFFRELLPELPYRPLYTNRYVVDELVTLLLYKSDREKATKAYESITESEVIQLLSVDDAVFEQAGEDFLKIKSEDISFTDHTIGVQAREKSVDYVLAYDGDFESLGLNRVPYRE